MLKIGTIALFSAKLISELHSVFEHMHATMKHWERPRCHMSHCIDACYDVTKRLHLLYWSVWGECPGTLSIIYFYVVECASCTKVLNKPINKYFCMHTSYVASVIQKMARL